MNDRHSLWPRRIWGPAGGVLAETPGWGEWEGAIYALRPRGLWSATSGVFAEA